MSVGFTAEELAIWSGGEWRGGLPRKINGISKDSRTIKQGELYLAIKGENFDGHEFAGVASDNGASSLIIDASAKDQVSSMGGSSSNVSMLLVDDTRKALCDIAREYREKVDPDVIGVTGSAGKTTVKEILLQLLSTTFRTAGTVGNWNNDIGLPLSILSMDIETEKAVFEIGTNHPGEIKTLASIMHPNCGLVTNIGPAHVGNFGSVDAIADEKTDLIRGISLGGLAVLNAESDYFSYMNRASFVNTLTVSESDTSDYSFVRIKETGKVLIKERASGEEMLFKPVMPGRHNVMNALMAIAVARDRGVGWANIKSALENMKQIPMRWEEVVMDEIRMINDAYNANPLSMRASITAFREQNVFGDKWLVLGSMQELGGMEQAEHLSLGEFVGTGDWAGVVLVGGCGDMMAQGIQTAGYESNRIFVCVNNNEAADILERNIQNGDAVLLKGSRMLKLEEVISRVQCHLE